jgi:hypothetical protein
MKALRKNLLMLMLLLQCIVLSAQKHSIKALAEVPVQFGLGYEYRVAKKNSISVQGGVLSEPNGTW